MTNPGDSSPPHSQPDFWDLLACPACKARLDRTDTGAVCRGCGTRYDSGPNGQLDLRLKGPATVNLEVVLNGLDSSEIDAAGNVSPFDHHPAPEVDFTGVSLPTRLKTTLLSHFPRARTPGAFMLDLGCGAAIHRQVCELSGFHYVGLDYREKDATLLGDAHALPFADASFEFILSIAVLEHLRYPYLGLREAFRVLKPGGRFIGTVAFMEPLHDASFYHHSHLGLYYGLRQAGFVVTTLGPNADWLALRALAEMTLFPKLPQALSRVLVKPLDLLHRAWWKVGETLIKSKGARESIRLTSTAGSFSFVAEKPAPAQESAA